MAFAFLNQHTPKPDKSRFNVKYCPSCGKKLSDNERDVSMGESGYNIYTKCGTCNKQFYVYED